MAKNHKKYLKRTAVGSGRTRKIFEMRSISDFSWANATERLFLLKYF